MNRAVYSALFLASFFLFIHTMYPAYKLDDSPETVAAALNLAIQHPPGYPLATILGKPAAHLLPGGIYAGINALSASLGAACAVLTASTVHSLFPGPAGLAGGAAAGIALALSELTWESALSAKGGIYLLNLFLVLIIVRLFASVPGSRRPGDGPTISAFLALGLALANHWMSAVWWIPSLLLAARPWTLRRALSAMTALVPGLSVYLALPFSVLREPAWGLPDTAGRLVEVVLRSDFLSAVSRKTASALPLQLLWGFFFPLREAGVLFLLVSVAGAVILFKLRREIWRFVFLGSLLTVIAVALTTDPRHPLTGAMSLWLTDRFFLPFQAAMAICLGAFAARLLPAARPAVRFSAVAGLAAVFALPLVRNCGVNDHSRDFLGPDFAENARVGMEPGAVFFAEADFQTFPLIANLHVDGHSPPSRVIVTNPFLNRDWGWRALPRIFPEARELVRSRRVGSSRIISLMDLVSESRPVYHGFLCSYLNIRARLQLHGIVYKLLPPGEKPRLLGGEETHYFFRRYRMRGLFSSRPHKDRMVKSVTDIYIMALAMPGEFHHSAGNHREAMAHYRKALRIPGSSGRAMVLSQFGHAAAQVGDYAEAEEAFRQAAHIVPSNLNFWTNLGTACAAQGKIPEAYRYLKYVLRVNPGHPAALANLRNLQNRLARIRTERR